MSTTGDSIHDVLLDLFPATKRPLEVTEEGDTAQNGDGIPNKIAKLDDENGVSKLKELEFVRILNVLPQEKRICIECAYKGEPAVLILEKTAFEEEITKHIVANFSEVLVNVKNLFRNDIYGSYMMEFALKSFDQEKNNLNQIFISIIHPAGPKVIAKYSDHPHHLVLETAELYRTVTKPYIEKQVSTPGHLQWLYNVLEHKAETDRIVYEENIDNDQGFILAKDMKWKCDKDELSDLEKIDIHFNALLIRRDVHTLRDLTAEHLPLLEAIYHRGRKAIADKYSISPQELRVYIHYQPSFYHLHVHFTHISATAGGFQAERAHMLSNVIENIRLMSDYYQRVALEFPLSSAAELKREQYDQ